jgi:hypothetical protein
MTNFNDCHKSKNVYKNPQEVDVTKNVLVIIARDDEKHVRI